MDEEFNYDYNSIASPLYENAVTSPLYEPKSPLSEHYEPMQFKYEPDANGTTPVAKQIKIYVKNIELHPYCRHRHKQMH